MDPYKKLTPFKWFCMQNFPFIEEDFDAITEYQLLCKIVEYLNKNIDKTNELGRKVEELNNWFINLDVQDEIDNKLNEMADDGTLAEIINEEIFNELNEKTKNNTLLLNDECKIFFPYRGQNAGDCSIIQNNKKTIIIDLGLNITSLINYLLNKGITKIDYIILSHYHADHIAGSQAEGFITLLDNENFDFSDLIVYLPHKGIDWNRVTSDDKTYVQNAESIIKNKIITAGYTYIEPENEDILELSSICNIKFLNIGSTFYNNYYGGDYYGGEVNQYNNFSMVCELKHNNRTVLYTGDIFVQAEDNITPFIKEPDILKAPHHDLELIASENFMKKLTSQIMIFEENQNYYGSGITTPISQTIKNNGGKIYDTNISQNINIILKNDNIICNSDFGTFTLQSTNVLTSSGIHIPLNTDLNNLKNQGNYFTLDNEETKTLLHLPLANEDVPYEFGRIKIINIGIRIDNETIKQIFISPVFKFYRFYNGEAGWSSWYNETNQNIIDITDNKILANTDLNDIFNIGKYRIQDNALLNTLLNCPASNEGGSILLVLSTRAFSDLRHQILLTATGNIYSRVFEMNTYNTEVHSMTDWKKITLSSVE